MKYKEKDILQFETNDATCSLSHSREIHKPKFRPVFSGKGIPSNWSNWSNGRPILALQYLPLIAGFIELLYILLHCLWLPIQFMFPPKF